MIDKLKEMFGERVITDKNDTVRAQEYEWYQTQDGTAFGVRSSELTERETKLLETLLIPLPASQAHISEEQMKWRQLLFDGELPDDIHTLQTNRILQIRIQSNDPEQELFEEAIQNMLSNKLVFLWQNPFNLLIIEPDTDELMTPNEFEDLLQTIESDLYMKAFLFIGTSFNTYDEALEAFNNEKHIFDTVLNSKRKERVWTLASSLPIFVVSEAEQDHIQFARENLFGSIDSELIETAAMLLTCNLNYSLAAKKLFIHRNSLQYRMDKFTEQTGLDLKDFRDAVTTYLLLQSR